MDWSSAAMQGKIDPKILGAGNRDPALRPAINGTEAYSTMTPVRVQFLGSGDAFGSGGRFQTCILVTAPDTRLIMDCGASSLIAMRQFGVEPNSIDTVLITHLHGDHFGGLPFFILDAHFMSRRTKPLTVAGPPGTIDRLAQAMEVLYPGSSQIKLRFSLEISELEPETSAHFGGMSVIPYTVKHSCGCPPYALRVTCGGKTVTYSGDTEWTDNLIPASDGADLMIVECTQFDKPVSFHLDYLTLQAHKDQLHAARIVLTHMGPDMLARVEDLDWEAAHDGKVIEL